MCEKLPADYKPLEKMKICRSTVNLGIHFGFGAVAAHASHVMMVRFGTALGRKLSLRH